MKLQLSEARCEATQPPALGVRAFDGNAPWKPRWILVLSLGITFGLLPPLARGQTCYESCQNSCRGLSGLITSSECVDTCARDCDKESDNQPRPYGAIAYGTDHAAEGISWNKGTQAEADQVALATCGKHGNNCKIVYRFRDTCAALAVAMGSQHYEGATGDTEKSAEANATAAAHLAGPEAQRGGAATKRGVDALVRAGPLVRLLVRPGRPTKGSAADQGARPTKIVAACEGL